MSTCRGCTVCVSKEDEEVFKVDGSPGEGGSGLLEHARHSILASRSVPIFLQRMQYAPSVRNQLEVPSAQIAKDNQDNWILAHTVCSPKKCLSATLCGHFFASSSLSK